MFKASLGYIMTPCLNLKKEIKGKKKKGWGHYSGVRLLA
jgi:hypothetical protein